MACFCSGAFGGAAATGFAASEGFGCGARLFEKFILLEHAAIERRIVAGPHSFNQSIALDHAAHQFHLRIDVVEMMQQQRFLQTSALWATRTRARHDG